MTIAPFAILGAACLVLAGPAAFAGSDAYVDGPPQAVYASPPDSPGQAEAYQGVGQSSAPLSTATALSGAGSESMPEFAGAPVMFGPPNVAVARRSARGNIRD